MEKQGLSANQMRKKLRQAEVKKHNQKFDALKLEPFDHAKERRHKTDDTLSHFVKQKGYTKPSVLGTAHPKPVSYISNPKRHEYVQERTEARHTKLKAMKLRMRTHWQRLGHLSIGA